MALNDKHARFVAEYLIDLNATQAAIRAGYSAKTARQQGERLLSKADIAAAVAEKQAAQLQKIDLTAERILEEMRRLALSDVRSLFDEDGNLKSIKNLTAEDAACIASLEVIKKNAEAGDGHIDTVHKLKVWDKTRALEMLGKHFGLLIERLEHHGELVIKWQDDS